MTMRFFILQSVCLELDTFFADASFFTGEFAQVVQFSTTHFTTTVNYDLVKEG